MATTDQVRSWYPDVVTNHADRGEKGFWPKCDLTKATIVDFPREGGGVYNLYVHPKQVEAWEAYVTVMVYHGVTVPSAGGTHNCRNIAGTNMPSLHAYCSCLDIPPNSRKPVKFQVDILKIKTKNGKTVFRNLASINDRMHDQIDVSPTDLATGINWTTVVGSKPKPPKPPADWTKKVIMALPTLKKGDGMGTTASKAKGPDVKRAQGLLLANGFKDKNSSTPETATDGKFGTGTETAVKNFQKSKKLKQDGIVGQSTWTKLLGE